MNNEPQIEIKQRRDSTVEKILEESGPREVGRAYCRKISAKNYTAGLTDPCVKRMSDAIRNVGCICGYGIGDPRCTDHGTQCRELQAALVEYNNAVKELDHG